MLRLLDADGRDNRIAGFPKATKTGPILLLAWDPSRADYSADKRPGVLYYEADATGLQHQDRLDHFHQG